ncbi:hypothetical protein DPEC_G00346810 [Dallia pectoralis]|uniref:Uncharacterized protein n=1 Tax=Dallia pectoralis TaxID=75939 RepID=A0ACC2F3V2_DALPE|nr:hypothetical protein DPEC_G00346810 [Dallia pectoralis]
MQMSIAPPPHPSRVPVFQGVTGSDAREMGGAEIRTPTEVNRSAIMSLALPPRSYDLICEVEHCQVATAPARATAGSHYLTAPLWGAEERRTPHLCAHIPSHFHPTTPRPSMPCSARSEVTAVPSLHIPEKPRLLLLPHHRLAGEHTLTEGLLGQGSGVRARVRTGGLIASGLNHGGETRPYMYPTGERVPKTSVRPVYCWVLAAEGGLGKRVEERKCWEQEEPQSVSGGKGKTGPPDPAADTAGSCQRKPRQKLKPAVCCYH